jgi:YggT family protein
MIEDHATLALSFLGTFFQLYQAVLAVRISLIWFPSVNWYQQPFYSLSKFTDSYLYMFRGAFPSIFGLDLSPIASMFLLRYLGQIVSNIHAQ